MADIHQVTEQYEDLPPRCLVSKAPFVLEVAADNTILPSNDLYDVSPGGTRKKWIRVSRFVDFVHACQENLGSTSGVITHDRLIVYIMPYLPVEDAFNLHQLIENPEPLPASYAEAVQILQAEADGQAVNPGALIDRVEPEEKRGVIQMVEFAVSMEFVVSNYEILWSKTRSYCMLKFLSDPMLQFVELSSICDQILGNEDSEEEADRLDANIENAKRQLLFAMYQRSSDADVHHVMLFMYPAIHAAVYLDCKHCVTRMHVDDDVVNSPETVQRLEASLVFIGYDKGHIYPTVEDSEYNLMMAQGRAEYNNYSAKTKQEFTAARELMRNSLAPIIHQIVLARQKLSLMGVIDYL